MSVSRLSDLIIEDNVLRVTLYKEVIDYVTDLQNELIQYEIKADEETNPELAAYRIYGDGELRWLIGIVCHVTDEFESLPVGYTVNLPTINAIYSIMRKVKNNASS